MKSSRSSRRSLILVRVGALALALLAFAIATPARSQQGVYQWWPLDGAPPGTPPTILLAPSSSPHQTVLDVTIHGFWFETIMQANQTFRRLSFDKKRDEAAYRIPGRPELPALHHLIGNLVGATSAVSSVQVLDQITIPGALIYPAQLPENEDQSHPFMWDAAFYAQTAAPYPQSHGSTITARGRMGTLDVLHTEEYLLRTVPATQTLLVARHSTVTIAHAGPSPITTLSVSRRTDRMNQLLLVNAPVVQGFRPPLIAFYSGRYLIVTAPLYLEEIEPLAAQKRRRGYDVDVVTTIETGATCASIQDYIADWWALGNPGLDHYVLLVGDTDLLPTCVSENLTASDKVYACIEGLGADGLADPYPEVRLGRLAPDTEAECTNAVSKTLLYEDGYPVSGEWLGDVTLACHDVADADYPGQYKDAQEAVRTYPFYTTPPTFNTRYGQDGATDAQVRSDVNSGRGLLAYRGHGSTTSWTNWNTLNEDFNSADVALLINDEKTPVILSIACATNDISQVYAASDCLGEAWTNDTEGAVAHFGASQCSDRSANDLLDLELFETIYADGATILSEAIAGAEAATMISEPVAGESNAWMYLLLGDPELEVWREPPPPIILAAPDDVPPGPSIVVVHAGASGRSVGIESAIVTLFKEGEVAESRYTDASGDATFTINPTTSGAIEVTAYTELSPEGVGHDAILVTGGTGAPDLASLSTRLALTVLSANPTRDDVALAYDLPGPGSVRLAIHDVRGRHVATLAEGMQPAGKYEAVWNGRAAQPGVYFAQLEHGGETRTKKIVLVR